MTSHVNSEKLYYLPNGRLEMLEYSQAQAHHHAVPNATSTNATRLPERLYVDLVVSMYVFSLARHRCVIIYIKLLSRLKMMQFPKNESDTSGALFSFFFHLTYSRWTSSLPSCLWSERIFPISPVHALHFFYRDASSALLQLINQWLNFTYSRSHAFRYERKNTNPTLVRIELTTSVLADVQLTY